MLKVLSGVLKALFGNDWLTTVIGYGSAVAIASVAYFGSHSEPGWYVVAAAFGALGRWAAREREKRTLTKVE